MAKSIEAKLENIQGLFTNSNNSVLGRDGFFTIPDYQRAYNWKREEQCDKLWQDLELFVSSNRNEAYFFGTIIINSVDNQLVVIDGQQRITTFMLLLKSFLIRISDALTNISDDEDSGTLRDALENRKRDIVKCLYAIDEDEVSLVTKGRMKFQELKIKYANESINEEYREEMRSILLNETVDEIQSSVQEIKYMRRDNRYTNFYKNFSDFLTRLEKLDITRVNALARALLNDCQVIAVISYETEEAIEIFNSLNSTGMPLGNADIISAKLYSEYKKLQSNESDFNKHWGEIVKDSNRLNSQKISSIDDILNQYMYIVRAEYGDKDTTVPGVRKYFTHQKKQLLENPEKFINGLKTVVDIWKGTANTAKITNVWQVLHRHNGNYKFFYATYFYYRQHEPEGDKLDFADALLRLFSLLSIVEQGYSTSRFKPFLIALNAEIAERSSTTNGFCHPSCELSAKINTHVRSTFDKNEIHDTLLGTIANDATVYLNEYLFAKEANASVDFSLASIDVEHIMPSSGRNVSSIRSDAGIADEEFKLYANKLGNKILLEKPINAAVGNDWFKTKKQNSVSSKLGYKDSKFPIAESLTRYNADCWTKADIDKATDKAAKRIVDFIFG